MRLLRMLFVCPMFGSNLGKEYSTSEQILERNEQSHDIKATFIGTTT